MLLLKKKINTTGLFATCFALSDHKQIIQTSHLPYQDGFYVTENDVVLKVCGYSIYVLTENGWEQNQRFLKLWYDGMADFADISPVMVEMLGLDKKNVVKSTKKESLSVVKVQNIEKTVISENNTIEDDTMKASCSEKAEEKVTVVATESLQGQRPALVCLDAYLIEYCEYVKCFYDAHKEEYAERLDNYYSLPESRMGEDAGDSSKRIIREIYEASVEKSREILRLEKEEGWEALYASSGSPDLLYSKIDMWNRCVNSDNYVFYRDESYQNKQCLSEEEKKKWISQLREVNDKMHELMYKAVKKHWCPLMLISGEYGQYNDVLYYDRELNLMVLCEPDDNYYHWGGYEYHIGVPTRGESHFDKERNIRYIHCPLDLDVIEFEYSEKNEKIYHFWEGTPLVVILCRV